MAVALLSLQFCKYLRNFHAGFSHSYNERNLAINDAYYSNFASVHEREKRLSIRILWPELAAL
jgi:hypothetical protein